MKLRWRIPLVYFLLFTEIFLCFCLGHAAIKGIGRTYSSSTLWWWPEQICDNWNLQNFWVESTRGSQVPKALVVDLDIGLTGIVEVLFSGSGFSYCWKMSFAIFFVDNIRALMESVSKFQFIKSSQFVVSMPTFILIFCDIHSNIY